MATKLSTTMLHGRRIYRATRPYAISHSMA
ncbi:hypothetical protein COLO4_33351 [Corchorus olitorius]|uniref:Uncharacterized protein n=1 Tax=Corchorus olitorius TaxID=93759 RepID=A0A1R3GUI3_9ROSI|nr:hypothetical protein COLO4_33351 [Corchorus olitorius]